MSNRIFIFDTTLRDGEQTPGVNLNVQEKIEIAMQLEKLGVDIMEAGFPAASAGDFEAVNAVAKKIKNASVAALCRAIPADLQRGYEALKDAVAPRIHTFIATSPIHMEYKLRMTPDQVVERAVAAVKQAKSYVNDVEFSPEDGSRSQPEFLYRVLTAVIDAGATVLNIPDTVGYSTPTEYFKLIEGIVKNVPNIDKAIISVHCHDDLGLATANSLAGMMAGARQIECTINGLGERAGNAALEEIVMGLDTRKDFYGMVHHVDTTQIHRISRMVSALTGVEVPQNKSIVGGNAFRHESGIHQHGVLAHSNTYEIMSPASIGLVTDSMVLGKHSGRHAFSDRLKQLGYTLDEKDLDAAFVRFKTLADQKKDINDRDLEALVEEDPNKDIHEIELVRFQTQSGNKITPTAIVEVSIKGQQKIAESQGDGPVDAAFKALDKLCDFETQLESYNIKAVSEGKDALGEVTVRVSYKERSFLGRGLSTDIIEASIRAYLNALNRILSSGGVKA